MKQSVNVRLTPKANQILAGWKKRFGGRNKSETITNVDTFIKNQDNETSNELQSVW